MSPPVTPRGTSAVIQNGMVGSETLKWYDVGHGVLVVRDQIREVPRSSGRAVGGRL
jgi:hypothetical protein